MSKYTTQGIETTYTSKYKHKAMKQYLCLNIYLHKAMKQHLCLNINKRHDETTLMSKYKQKAMKQYLYLDNNTRQ